MTSRLEPTADQLAALAARPPDLPVVMVNLLTVIGDGACPGWDAILIVEYPSPQAFLDMIADPEYLVVHEHRAAALQHGDLIATSMWTMAD